eukprot:388229_1
MAAHFQETRKDDSQSVSHEISEYFDKIGKHMSINKTKRLIEIKTGWNTAYGSTIIDPQDKGAYIWDFKVIQSIGEVYIGIEYGDKCLWINENFAGKKKRSDNYSYCSNGRIYSHNTSTPGLFSSGGIKFGETFHGDAIISMKVDFSSDICGKIYFKKQNETKWKMAFNDINTNKTIKMAVSLWGDKLGGGYGSTIELLDYHQVVNESNINQKQNILNATKTAEFETELNQIKQANENLQNEINKYKKLLSKEEEAKEEEEKRCNNNYKQIDRGKVLNERLKFLHNEFADFIADFDEEKLTEIYNKSTDLLLIINDRKEIDKFKSCLELFNTRVVAITDFIASLSNTNIKEYQKWNINQMILWISSLDNGRFAPYLDVLRQGFESDSIDSGDWLPELDRNTLGGAPFNIRNFKDRVCLEKHFKSLLQTDSINNKPADKEQQEEGLTPYI